MAYPSLITEQKKPAALPWQAMQPITPKPMVNPTALPGAPQMGGGTPATAVPGQMPILKPLGAPQAPAMPGPVGATPTNTTMTTANVPGAAPGRLGQMFNDMRGQTIGAPSAGGPVAAPKAGAGIAAQNAQPTVDALSRALETSVSPESGQLRDMSMEGLRGLSSAPNRAALAAESFRLSNEASAPAFAQDMRKVGQNAAAFGRTGSGMTTNELTDLALTRGRDQDRTMAQLANEAAGLEMSDRLSTLDRTTGYESQVGSEDRARGGFERDIANNQFDIGSAVRGQNVDERDYATTEGWRRSDLGERNRAFDSNERWRGTDLQIQQQGRQDQQGQQAIDNARMQELLQEQLLGGDFDRKYRTAELAGREGYGNDPYGLQMDGAGIAQDNASGQAAGLAEQARYEAFQRALAAGGGTVDPRLATKGNRTQGMA